jgi:hypothetical protein
MFTGAENGDLKFIKLNPQNDTLSHEGQMKLDGSIHSLQVFYNNEKLVLVSVLKENDNVAYIINV